eukprot:1174469-Amphidinium_carterae.1
MSRISVRSTIKSLFSTSTGCLAPSLSTSSSVSAIASSSVSLRRKMVNVLAPQPVEEFVEQTMDVPVSQNVMEWFWCQGSPLKGNSSSAPQIRLRKCLDLYSPTDSRADRGCASSADSRKGSPEVC